MATSSIRFKDLDVFIKDNYLGEIIKIITSGVNDLISERHKDAEWLLEACGRWSDDYENMPPGLKDIELDEWLISNERLTIFKLLIEKIYINFLNNTGNKVMEKELKKILEMLSK